MNLTPKRTRHPGGCLLSLIDHPQTCAGTVRRTRAIRTHIVKMLPMRLRGRLIGA